MTPNMKKGTLAETSARPHPCRTCRHWENGEAAANHYIARRNASLKRLPKLVRLADQGKANPENARFKVFDAMLRSGSLGVCLIGKSETDFCSAEYGRATAQLSGCNHWDGRP